MSYKKPKRRKCNICSRLVKGLSNHHSLPKVKKKKKAIGSNGEERICFDCHKAIHYIFTNKELRKIGGEGIRIDEIEAYRTFFPTKVHFLEIYISAIQQFNESGMRKPREFFYMIKNGRLIELDELRGQEKIEFTWRRISSKKKNLRR